MRRTPSRAIFAPGLTEIVVRPVELCALLGGFCVLPVVVHAQDSAGTTRVVSGATCAPVVLQPAGVDSASVAPLLIELTTSLTRQFRPATPDDTAARLVLTVTSNDIRERVAGIYDRRVQPAARLAVAGARRELSKFKSRPGATPIEFVASFEPRCVTDFSVPEPSPTQGAYFEFQVTDPVQELEGSSAPVYPPTLLAAHVEGRVIAQFVVDAYGRPEVGTFKVLMSSNDLFSDAVRHALPGMRFVPATLGGRRVRQVVQVPFTFAER